MVCIATFDKYKDYFTMSGINCWFFPGGIFKTLKKINFVIIIISVLVIPLIPIVLVLGGLGAFIFSRYGILCLLYGIWGPKDAFDDSSCEEFPFTLI